MGTFFVLFTGLLKRRDARVDDIILDGCGCFLCVCACVHEEFWMTFMFTFLHRLEGLSFFFPGF